ncbi:mevalonate kinase [Zerene cesonia]|uniref:mevalonate kinase n=1 Tax=Zerene cesonia TaxID=33412 RepID=UPI0018E51DA1|nr:mevalonate kinase [Zerene cesonia]
MDRYYCVKLSAPGKVILHGEHSVVFGKTAIAVSVGLRSSICIKEIQESVFKVNLPAVGLHETISLELINKELLNHKTSYIEAPEALAHEEHLTRIEIFVKDIISNFEHLPNVKQNALRSLFYVVFGIFGGNAFENGLEITIVSDLTIGAGTGSSASFAVCLAGALLQLAKLKKGIKVDRLSLDDKKLISKWAFNCEKITHGTPSGIDNTTSTFGSLVTFRKGQEPGLLDIKLGLRILLVDTGVSRETKVLAANVRSLMQRNKQAVDCVMEAIDHIAKSALEILQNFSSCDQNGGIDVKYQYLAELWNMNHCLLASLGVSHSALESIRASALARGLACKLTGAGGGGYAIVLIPPSTKQSIVDELSKELSAKGFVVTDTILGSPGVTLDS